MAKVTFGAVVTNASGKLAGIVYRRNRSGPYVGPKTTPLDPTKGRRATIQANIATLEAAWHSDLTDDERTAWYTFALARPEPDRFGRVHTLPGFLWFSRVNGRLLNADEALLAAPPATFDALPITALSSTATDTPSLELLAYFDPSPTPDSHRLEIYAAEPQSIARYSNKGLLRFLIAADPGQDSPYDFTAAYTDRFGVPASPCSLHVAASLLNITNGARSQRFSTRVIL